MSKVMSKSVLMTALICGNVLWGGTAVHAEEALQEYSLDTMVVTATRTAQDNIKVAATVDVVTAEDIKKKNVLTITDALKTIPGVFINRPGGMSENANSIQMRGFEEDSILVLYDGMPMNDGYSGKVNWNAIAIDQVAKIEVLQGAASSLYGGRAVGGVINIISKDADKDSAHVYMHYGSDSTWKRGVGFTKKIGDKLSLGFGYENKETDGHQKKVSKKKKSDEKDTASGNIGSGAISDKDYTNKDIYLLGTPGTGASEDNSYNFNLKYKFNDDESLSYRYTHDKFKYFSVDPVTYIHDANGNPMYSGSVKLPNGKFLNFSESDFADYDGYRTIDRHAFQYKDDANKINFNLGLTNVKDSGFSSCGSNGKLSGEGAGTEYSYPNKTYKADFQKVWEIGNHTLVSGFDVEKSKMDYTIGSLKNWKDHNSITSISGKSGGSNFLGALFVQDQLQFNDIYGVDFGVRFDYYKNKDEYSNAQDKKYTEFSPKVAFKYTPDDDTTYYVSYGHSFNAPTLYQLYRTNGNYIANPDLKPETTDTFEIGLKKNFGEKLYASLALYNAKTSDMIDYIKNNGKYKYININEAKRQGAEISLDYKVDDKFSVFTNLALQNAKDGKGERLYEIPKQTLKAGVKYDYDKWSAYLNGQYVSSRLSPGEIGGRYFSNDAFFTADAGVSYKFMKNATVSFAVDNIFDRDYWNWAKSAGRTWTMGVDFTF